jgi:ATP/maltotriose-dependent transcriptional regulator MalT
LDEQEAAGRHHPGFPAQRATALAQLGRFEEARRLATEARTEMAERGQTHRVIVTSIAADVEALAGDLETSIAIADETVDLLERAGEQAWQSTFVAARGHSHYRLGDLDQAEADGRRALELGATDDAATQMLARGLLAKVAARRGDAVLAEQLAREGTAISEQTEQLTCSADAYADLAEVLRLIGKEDEAQAANDEALERYERKGHVVGARRARAFAGYDEARAPV